MGRKFAKNQHFVQRKTIIDNWMYSGQVGVIRKKSNGDLVNEKPKSSKSIMFKTFFL
ncbi:hypothetical protein [Breznakia pachnodae]|uniref:Recombinase domain-containing protein n=1 Tax=Breznakia pachnodae TaxID=265178 RepID=A0ABU0DXS7_9FIRM|nr:hypothetical protein [Breznakia pachnodae]MDQ0359443.1 hypothetical protein [Breznakia pachnodae]